MGFFIGCAFYPFPTATVSPCDSHKYVSMRPANFCVKNFSLLERQSPKPSRDEGPFCFGIFACHERQTMSITWTIFHHKKKPPAKPFYKFALGSTSGLVTYQLESLGWFCVDRWLLRLAKPCDFSGTWESCFTPLKRGPIFTWSANCVLTTEFTMTCNLFHWSRRPGSVPDLERLISTPLHRMQALLSPFHTIICQMDVNPRVAFEPGLTPQPNLGTGGDRSRDTAACCVFVDQHAGSSARVSGHRSIHRPEHIQFDSEKLPHQITPWWTTAR